MIEVTRLDNSKLWVNAALIQSIQSTPDTVITFTTHDKMMVREPVEEVSQRILAYHKQVYGMDTFPATALEEPRRSCMN